jgi:hypothetical protein
MQILPTELTRSQRERKKEAARDALVDQRSPEAGRL